MARQLSVSSLHASRSLAAARRCLKELRSSFEYRLGRAFFYWAKRPWEVDRWRQLWPLLTAPPEPSRPRLFMFWALQFAPDPATHRPATRDELEVARQSWDRWLEERLGPTTSAGEMLVGLRRGPRHAYLLAENRWRSRDRRAIGPMLPLPATPAVPIPRRCAALGL